MRRFVAVATVLLVAGCASTSAGEPTADTTPAATTAAADTTIPGTRSTSTTTAVGAATSTSTTTSTTAPSTTTTTSTTTSTTTTTTTTSTTTTTTVPTTTRCTDVAHISDSTGVYLWEPQYVDGLENTMGERYRSVGVERWIDDSSGGRSARERVDDWQTNAVEAADLIRQSGFTGCWVVMIGTNDAANVAAGSNLGYEERILQLLYVFGDDPVLWVDAATLRSETAYRNDNMRAWNDTLYRLAAERDHVQVLRWSESVRPEWFVSDGIHMGTEGRIWRAALTAAALVFYFPG